MSETPDTSPTAPEGLGGWLILPIIGLFAKPIAAASTIYLNLIPNFHTGMAEWITQPETVTSHRLETPLLVFQLGHNVVLSLLAIILLVLAFRRHPFFPTGVIFYYLLSLFVVLSEHFISIQIPARVAEFGKGLPPEALVRLAATVVLVPYFLFSKRVKNTFRPRQAAPAIR